MKHQHLPLFLHDISISIHKAVIWQDWYPDEQKCVTAFLPTLRSVINFIFMRLIKERTNYWTRPNLSLEIAGLVSNFVTIIISIF